MVHPCRVCTGWKSARPQLIVDYSPISFQAYLNNCPSAERFRRALGITSIAHFYEATELIRWAIKELLDYLEEGSTPEFLARLYRLGALCHDIDPALAEKTFIAWKRMISTSDDPIAALGNAKGVQDEYLQAYAYYHILQKTTGQIADDTRLTTLDRLRLMAGSLNLRRYETPACNCSNRHLQVTGPVSFTTFAQVAHTHRPVQATRNEYRWSPRVEVPELDNYDGHTLWNLFTRSPLGINLSDGLDATPFALPHRVKRVRHNRVV